MKRLYSLGFALLCGSLLAACSEKPTMTNVPLPAETGDPYAWLEQVESPQALDFVNSENQKTLRSLRQDPRFPVLQADLQKIASAEDRLPWVQAIMKDHLYNFWQDEAHPHGVWRRTTLQSYRRAHPVWETIVDLDALSAQESENWVWRGANCLNPAYQHCMISLSRGGKDAVVRREFDLNRKDFVSGGFMVPESKGEIAWKDEDSLYVSADFGPGTLTESGYPREVHLWKRGQPLAQSSKVFEVSTKDITATTEVCHHDDRTATFHIRLISGERAQIWHEDNEGHRLEIPMPQDAEFEGVYKDLALFLLRSDLVTSERIYRQGSLVGISLDKLAFGDHALLGLEVLFAPNTQRFLTGVTPLKNEVLITILDKVQGKILRLREEKNHRWVSHEVPLNSHGTVSVSAVSYNHNQFLLSSSDFLIPPSAYWIGGAEQQPELVKRAPSRFSNRGLVTEQWLTRSSDGTPIYYFIVHRKDWKKDGQNPTLLFGYGGFEISMVPSYLETTGKAWLERGGVYVLATIRGGGEFGPAWHESVSRENRQKAFDDFTAVAQNLIARNVTSPSHLGIQGRSNGGLLVGASFIQHPELYNAVLCQVPLLDMLRYHQLLAGASWESEYGNPEDPAMREALLKYSPFQNLRAGVHYPEVFFMTSSKDDRVHPYHARKMAARMQQLGMPALYFENTEGGGHAGSANIEQKVLWNTLEYTYLWKKLGPVPGVQSRRLATGGND